MFEAQHAACEVITIVSECQSGTYAVVTHVSEVACTEKCQENSIKLRKLNTT